MRTLPNTITISIRAADRLTIATLGECLVVVGAPAPGAAHLVVGAVIRPSFRPETTITFGTQWQVFATSELLMTDSSVVLHPQLLQASTVGHTYAFCGVGWNALTSGLAQHVGLANHSPVTLSLGLAQAISTNASFNHESLAPIPLAVVAVAAGQTSYVQPTTKVYVLLAKGLAVGTVLPASLLDLPARPARRAPASLAQESRLALSTAVAVDYTTNPTLYFNPTARCLTLTPPAGS